MEENTLILTPPALGGGIKLGIQGPASQGTRDFGCEWEEPHV